MEGPLWLLPPLPEQVAGMVPHVAWGGGAAPLHMQRGSLSRGEARTGSGGGGDSGIFSTPSPRDILTLSLAQNRLLDLEARPARNSLATLFLKETRGGGREGKEGKKPRRGRLWYE